MHSYFVTYDICEPKRWRKVFKTMHGYGRHVQLSVFLCDLDETRYETLLSALEDEIDSAQDQVLLVKIARSGRSTGERIEALGRPYEHRSPGATIV
ncbi:MAG: CRISPR-associated endonuclease Cas2 [Acidobacteriota bacterium]